MKQTLMNRADGRLVYSATFEPEYGNSYEMEDRLEKILTAFDYTKKTQKEYDRDAIIGRQFIIASMSDGNELVKIFIAEDNGEGIPGNSNENIKCYHGWRGSWHNCGTYGQGLRRIESISVKEGDEKHTSKIRIVFGRDEATEQD